MKEDNQPLKVLFVTFFFPPCNRIPSVRTGKIAKHLVEFGFDVKVLTAHNPFFSKTLPVEISLNQVYYTDLFSLDIYLLKLLSRGQSLESKEEEVKAIRTSPGLRARLWNKMTFLYQCLFHFPDRYWGWYPFAVKQAKAIIKNGWRPNIIYSSALPITSHWVAHRIAQLYQVPWVAEYRDLWVENHYEERTFWGKYIANLLEKKILKNVSALVTVSEPLKEILEKKYSKETLVIRNGFDEEDFVSFGNLDHCFPQDKINIVYTGRAYYGKRTPLLLFQAIRGDSYLKQRIKIYFYGWLNYWVLDLAKEYEVEENVEIHGEVTRQEAISRQKAADGLLLLTWDDPKERGILTGKFFEYLGAQRPILVLGNVEDLPAQIVRELGIGVAARTEDDVRDFLYNLDRYRKNITPEKVAPFNRRHQSQKLAELLIRYARE